MIAAYLLSQFQQVDVHVDLGYTLARLQPIESCVHLLVQAMFVICPIDLNYDKANRGGCNIWSGYTLFCSGRPS